MSTRHLGPGTVILVDVEGRRWPVDVSNFEIVDAEPKPHAAVAVPKPHTVEFTVQMHEASGAQAMATLQCAFGAAWAERLAQQLAQFEEAAVRARLCAGAIAALVDTPAPRAPALPPGPRARGKAQWKRERFSR